MFLDRSSSQGECVPHTEHTGLSPQKTGQQLLKELESLPIDSWTGLTERRELIRTWSAEELIRAYTALKTHIIRAGEITHEDTIILEAMEKEGQILGGAHTKKIHTINGETIPHGVGLSVTDGHGNTYAGSTQLSVWKLVQ